MEHRRAEPDSDLCYSLSHLHDERVYLMGLIVRAYRHLIDHVGRALENGVAITPAFFDVLIHIAAAPEGRLTMSRLSEEVALTTGGMTRLVDRMVEAGLVVRENSAKDRRSIHVVLTEAGQDVLGGAVSAYVASIDRYLFAPLKNHDRQSLAVTLGKVLDRECL